MQDVTNTQVSRATLSRQGYEALKSRILSGDLKQGQKIAEVAVSEEFGVSATPVREALRLLNGDGLIHFEGRRGARVIEIHSDEVKHSYDVRKALEIIALREAAAKFTSAEKEHFIFLAKNTETSADDPFGFIDADRSFHEFFIRKTENQWILKFYREIGNFLLILRLSKMTDWKIGASVKEHIEIAQAVADGDVDKAVEVLTRQIDTSQQWSLKACGEHRPGSR
jgi:DNA-binding GntR family transcriptional regulator